jgi:acetyl-CoA acetyltransferase
VNQNTRPVAVLGSNRIPFSRSNGPYAQASNHDMLTAALDNLIDRTGIAGERLGEVAGGAVLKHARDFNLTRESLLGTRLSHETPAYDVGQACGTGLETFILTANKIALGQAESAIACGVDTTSDAPIELNDDLANGGSDRLIDALIGWGDVEAIAERIEEHFDAGADHVCIQPKGGDRLEDYRALAAALGLA